MKLDGKIALVTGSSRGIGKAIALELGKEGASVIITYNKNKTMAEEVSKQIPDSFVIELDISNRNSIKNAVNEIIQKYGRIDILVNNAGINKPTDFEEVEDNDWDNILTTNLKGPFMLSQEVFPIMKKQKQGRIINISSVSGQYGGPRTVHYAVSKAGLISLGQCLARFGAPYNITANNIAPGIISTDMAKDFMQSSTGKNILKKTLLERPGTTKEVATTVVFLSSDDSSYITGQTFNVNGGHLLRT